MTSSLFDTLEVYVVCHFLLFLPYHICELVMFPQVHSVQSEVKLNKIQWELKQKREINPKLYFICVNSI